MPEPHRPTAILILAAGKSSRMRGADKLLEPVEGQPLIRRQALVALATGLPVWITLPPDRPMRKDALFDLPYHGVEVADADLGIAQSIKAGNAAIPESLAVLLWLADLPEITSDDVKKLLNAARSAPDAIVRATTETGKPGHPVLFPPRLRGDFATLSGDNGAGKLLRDAAANTVFVPLSGNRALTDLDTPEDWADWRKR